MSTSLLGPPSAAASHHQQRQYSQRDDGDRVVLLLDLDCFYAQCERIRLGFSDPETCCIALLQWNSCLAVSYPARAYGIKRGDGFEQVAQKSQGKCMAVHVPILETSSDNVDFDGDFASEYCQSQEEQLRLRRQDIGRRRYATEGKACLERYRVASRRIFDVVKECLGLAGNSSSKSGIILEKASIDEFFLDVTTICRTPDHPLWETILKQQQIKSTDNDKQSQQNHKTVLVGDNNTNTQTTNDMQQEDPPNGKTNNYSQLAHNYPELDRGCQLAQFIRQSVYRELGFTLSAGISVNKMVAKLAASYGKPNGQAVVVPDQILTMMASTKLSKVRNFGGKLGRELLQVLPPGVPETMGSVAKYLSLPQLQQQFSAESAHFIFRACRGQDNEQVQTESVVKSITAFKSLPRSVTDTADVQDNVLLGWIELLVKEVVSRVETDAKTNQRYPRNCTIHYGCAGNLNAAGRLDMKSFRVPFPSQKWPAAQKIAHLMDVIPHKIVEREVGTKASGASSSSSSTRKRVQLVRIGVCATEMNEQVNKQGSIANYFSSCTTPATTTNGSRKASVPVNKDTMTAATATKEPERSASQSEQNSILESKKRSNPYAKPVNPYKKASKKVPKAGTLATKSFLSQSATVSPKTPAASWEDASVGPRSGNRQKDNFLSREVQKTDHESEIQTLNIPDGEWKSMAVTPSTTTSQTALQTTDGEGASIVAATTSQSASAEVPSNSTVAPASSETGAPQEDPDLELAKRLQASFDKEERTLRLWDATKKKGSGRSSGSSIGSGRATKKAKAKRISSFFRASSPK
ncbi:DNA polymerase eta [Seminavis robusta]|uniref:DNA polymerase eta n=1 Tax=Seminavis robusta TaxID=568900 RepID=A0A9N8DZ58_9STRA|nr:DNA polymerase eta [Seminavis robusta]|eukprot:Sro492_g153880.1 DNA polymerase eta (806) ;mRNA; f:32355-34772